ncbi:MAG: CotH kinase family protein [Paludibacteraceae bacterium]|nr:CotH kinase family protein [Paludibacteraceae bacterium]
MKFRFKPKYLKVLQTDFLVVSAVLLSVFLWSCDPENVIVDKPVNDSVPVTDNLPKGLLYVYDDAALAEITINATVDEWNKLLQWFDMNPDNEEYIVTDFEFKKGKYLHKADSTGLRLRGNTSRRRPEGNKGEVHNPQNPDWKHASFSVKFNKYVKGRKIADQEKINLKWHKDDAMYVREMYCYDLFERAGVWTAPQASYSKLNVRVGNVSAYYGVYLMVEPVDNEFLQNRLAYFGDDQGFLWKANWGADFASADKNKMGLENVTLENTFTPVYDLKTREADIQLAKTQLADFITKFNSKKDADFEQWLTSVMDVELFLKTYAVNVLCGMWDDYWNNKNNFYFYFNSVGRFFFIPYDYDNTLGTSLIMKDAGRQNVLSWGQYSHPLVRKIIDIEKYKNFYLQFLRTLVHPDNDYFYVSKSKARILHWHQLIDEYISNDTGEDMEIIDRPASWGNCGFYRLLDDSNNFFVLKAASIP